MIPFKSLGLDLSATATGAVVLAENSSGAPTVLLEREITTKGMSHGVTRNRHVVLNCMQIIHEHKPDRIVVEGYALGKNANAIIPVVEIGGLLRFMMALDELTWFTPSPSEMKKFVSGKGNTPKDQVMMWVLKRWEHTSKTNNTSDAYGLAAMGLGHANRLIGMTKDMRAIVGAMSRKNE